MDCPYCGEKRSKVWVTEPADTRNDGRTGRKRKCKTCNRSFSTLEMLLSDVRALEKSSVPQTSTGVNAPLPTSPASQLLDIEDELEQLLPQSIQCLRDTMTSSDEPSKVKVDTARWLVSDRREYRKALQVRMEDEGAGDDPALQQLANILRVV